MENEYKEIFKEWTRAVLSVLCAFALLALGCLICGCTTTRYVPMPEYHTESIRTDTAIYNAILRTFRESVRSNQRSSDSVVHLNKETVTLNEHGDTTRHDKTEYIYLSSYKEREYERIINEQRDSIGRLSARLESAKADSVPVPYPVERIVEVERERTRWEAFLMVTGGLALLTGLVLGGVWLWRRNR